MLLYGPDGQRIPKGRVKRTLSTTPDLTALPSWLTTTVGTTTVTQPTAGLGGIALQAAGNAWGEITTSFDVDCSYFKEISIHADGLRFSNDDLFIAVLQIKATNKGVALRQESGGQVAFVRTELASPVDVNTRFKFRGGGDGVRHRNVSLLLHPADEVVYVLMDDSEVAKVAVPDLATGAVRPGIALRSASAATRTAYVEQLRVDLVSN